MSDILSLVNTKLNLDPPLEGESMKVIGEFLLLWNMYESTLFNSNYSSSELKKKLDADVVKLEDVETPYAYMKGRYLESGRVNQAFNSLQFRSNDFPNDVIRALEEGGSMKEKSFAVLSVIYRLRNNLFHGLKQVATFNMQRINFEMARKVLTDVLWQT